MKKTMILMTALALLTGCAETAAQSLNETEETVSTVNETRTDTADDSFLRGKLLRSPVKLICCTALMILLQSPLTAHMRLLRMLSVLTDVIHITLQQTDMGKYTPVERCMSVNVIWAILHRTAK